MGIIYNIYWVCDYAEDQAYSLGVLGFTVITDANICSGNKRDVTGAR